jgi:ankyrin repeat protein
VVESILLARNVDVNGCNEIGQTALHWAARYDQARIVDLLLERTETDVNVMCDGKTALMLASQGPNLNFNFSKNSVKSISKRHISSGSLQR